MKCIICRKEKCQDELSDEHVIPDSIGGVYHIYNVCKDCNSYLGRNVDNKLVNHYFTSFMRYDLNIKGKTGKLPNPFDGTHILINDNETKVKMILDENGIPRPYLLPKIEKTTHDNKLVVKLHIDTQDENKINKIIEKILKREKIDKNSHQIITDTEPNITRFRPNIRMEKQIDLKEFKIGLLKIAYEFAVDSIEDFFEDKEAIEISNFLLNSDFEKIDNYFIGSGFEKEILKPLETIFNFNKKRHLLVLMDSKELGLVCFISLYNLFNIVVKLSENRFVKENMIIGVNDLENNNFEKLDFFEVSERIYSNEEKRFMYYFNNPEEYNLFLAVQQTKDFQYYMKNNKLPIFNNDFKIKYHDVNDLIEDYLNKEKISYIGDGINHKNLIEFSEELYLKILPINKFFQIKALETEQKLLSKF